MTLWLLAACSFSTFEPTSCSTGAECRDAFGFGYTCGDEGLCVALEQPARCDYSWPEDLLTRPEAHRDAIIVGSLFDHSTDIPEAQATRLAFQQLEDVGGLDGRELALVQCSYEEDDALDALAADEATEAMATWLAAEAGAHAVIGPATSGMTEVAWRALDPLGAMLVSPSATSPALTWLDGVTKSDEDPGLLWRTAPPDSLQGRVMAEDVLSHVQDAAPSVALLYQVGPYGEGLAEVFGETFTLGGGTVVLAPFENDTQIAAAIGDAAAADVDAVVFVSSDLPDVVAFFQGVAGGYPGWDLPIWLGDAARDAELLSINLEARELFPLVRGTAPGVPSGAVYEFFASSYALAFDGDSAEDSSYTSYAYDAAWLVAIGSAYGLYRDEGVTGLGTARGLRKVSAGPALEIKPLNWSTALQYWQEGGGMDLAGASGELDFDPETGETSGPIDVWVIEDGAFVTETTVQPEGA